MCGRVTQSKKPETLAEELAATVAESAKEQRPRFNAGPQSKLLILVPSTDGGRTLERAKWGLSRGTMDNLTNARDEKLANGLWKGLFHKRRCVVPVDGFYEWKRDGKAKLPFYFTRSDGSTLYLAGMYDEPYEKDGEDFRRFLVITTTANRLMSNVHDRMPVILSRADVETWLATPEAKLVGPSPDSLLTAWPVSTRVNSIKNDDAELVVPLSEQRLLVEG